mgnify:CR=1 FL=1
MWISINYLLFTGVNNHVNFTMNCYFMAKGKGRAMSTSRIAAIWERVLAVTQKEINPGLWETWIKTSIIPLSMTEDSFEIGVPKEFVREWISKTYLTNIQRALTIILNKNMEIIITNLNIPDDEDIDDCSGQGASKPTSKTPTRDDEPIQDKADDYFDTIDDSSVEEQSSELSGLSTPTGEFTTILNPKYTFETFVIGNSNRFPHAASLAVAEAPAKAYNPFFLYGGVGLGKTHLMHAIGHRILQTNPSLKVLYISSEKFTNDLINSIRDNTPEAFRQKYRNIDVLLVDDIQFLTKKERTQEEFFHTFNTLHEANKQIIISSDRPPKEIQTLEDRLRSRFEWGLITDIKPPDLETRIAILRKKAMIEKMTVPNDVMVLIASRIDNNIRELEGALIRVMAYASLNHLPIDINTATEALKDLFPNGSPRQITLETVQTIVCSFFKLKMDELVAKKRTRNIVYPRQIAMYLCREMTEASLPRIGEVFGGRDHTTVLHAHDKIAKERNEDSKLNNTINELIKRIENGSA